jgi:putative nucleotidyltransferase with HDIG domain
MISRSESLKLVKKHVKNRNLVKHMIAVGSIMHGLAENMGEDPVLWESVGILHDIDYEEVGEDWEKHGLVSAEMVTDYLPKEALQAIKSHNPQTSVEAKEPLEIALLAADGLSGLLVATALMMPDKKLEQVKVRSIRRKFKDSSFARGVNRDNILRSTELGYEFDEFLRIGLESMKKVSGELGL